MYMMSVKPTHVQTERWNTGSIALCCLASAACWPATLHWGNPQTYCRCNRWPAASWGRHIIHINVRNILCFCNSYKPVTVSWTHQLLLSTASPKPGVSTIVSRRCTPPSFTRTFDCSTCKAQESWQKSFRTVAHNIRLLQARWPILSLYLFAKF